MGDFYIGLDLGQAADYTAVAVVERLPQWETATRTVREGAMTRPITERIELDSHLHCRQLERLDPGTKYPDIVRRTVAMMLLPELSQATLLIDGTGVGRGVVDLFQESPIAERVEAISVTAGEHEHFAKGYWHVPKRNLVAAAQLPMQDGRMKIAAASQWADLLTRELLSFKIKITAAANDTYGAWREGEHDDLVFAVMLPCWWIARIERIARQERNEPPVPPTFGMTVGMPRR